MRRYIVVNAKGGSGKTTVATNLAACLALRGWYTTLLDYDPQYSSLAWLKCRDQPNTPVHGVAAYEPSRSPLSGAWQTRVPRGTQRIVVDTPAGLRAVDLLGRLMAHDTLVLPVQPSAIDIRAAADFIRDLILITKVKYQQRQLAIVPNRVRRTRASFETLNRFLNSQNIPVLEYLRDSQYYPLAYERGIGVAELEESHARADAMQWQTILDWLETGATDQPAPQQTLPLTTPAAGNIRPVIATAPVPSVATLASRSTATSEPVRIPSFLTRPGDSDTRH